MRGLVRVAFVFAALFAVLASRRGAHAARPVVHDPRRGPSAPRRSDVARAAHLRGDVSRAAPDRLVDVDVDPRVASIDPAEGGDLADLPPLDSGAIPKVIHLLWKTDELPEFAREFVHSWVRLHPPGRCVDGQTRPCSRSSARTSPGTRRCGEGSPPGYSERTRSDTWCFALSAACTWTSTSRRSDRWTN